jgi:hypothetical protein
MYSVTDCWETKLNYFDEKHNESDKKGRKNQVEQMR